MKTLDMSRRWLLGWRVLAAAAFALVGLSVALSAPAGWSDAGRFWARRGLLKRSGVITVTIGPPVQTAGREPRDINAEAQAWIEATINGRTGSLMNQ